MDPSIHTEDMPWICLAAGIGYSSLVQIKELLLGRDSEKAVRAAQRGIEQIERALFQRSRQDSG